MKNILIISGSGDAHAEHMCNILIYKKIPFFLLLSNKYPFEAQITLDLENNYIIEHQNKKISLDSNWSIWNRRIFSPDFPKNFPKNLEEIVIEESKRTLQSLIVMHKGLVINSPFDNFRANNKLEQLRYAKKIGLNIPDTVITNEPEKAKDFYERHNGNIIFKMQKLPIIKIENDVYKTILTNKISYEDFINNFERIRNNPCFFQEKIEKRYEIRLTIIGKKLFPIAIYSQNSEISRDDFRRYDFDKVEYKYVEIPEDVTKKTLKLMEYYGLHYAAIDIIYTPGDKYVFLEVNPNGQYLWTEEMSGVPITESFADYLSGFKNHPKRF